MKILIISPVSTDEPISIRLYTTNLIQKIKGKFPVKYFHIQNINNQRLLSKFLEVFYRYLIYPLYILFSNNDLVHITDHTYAYLSIFAKISHKKVVVTLLNRPEDILSRTTLTLHKENMYLPDLNILLFRFSINQLHRADKIICVSESVRKSALSFGLADKKLVIIHGPVSDVFFSPLTKSEERQIRNEKLKKKNIFYVLHVGTNDRAHKNVEYVFECLKILKKKGYPVFFVKAGDKFNSRQTDLIEQLDVKDRIIHLGNLNQINLRSIYKISDVLLFPSFFEGCPAPPFEALLSGIPVIVSDIPPHGELLKDCAYFVNPFKPVESVKIIQKMIHKQIDFRNKIQKGKSKAKYFCWNKIINQTLNAYEQLSL